MRETQADPQGTPQKPPWPKSPLAMDYHELDVLLNSLLEAEGLPCSIEYRSSEINYHRFNKGRLLAKILFRFLEADFFYRTYIRPRITPFKKTEFFKFFRIYYYLFKIGLADVIKKRTGTFDNKLPANYIIAAMLYDAACDVTDCRKYLKEFDEFIMFDKPPEPRDAYLRLFLESVGYIKNAVDEKTFERFKNYIRIEHVSQLMSISQLSEKHLSRDHLLKITLAKGGISVLAGMHLLVQDLNREERRAIYEIGGVCQILEDIFDIEEDLKLGIQTLPNQKLIGYEEMKQIYCGTTNHLIDTIGFDPYKPSVTLDIFWSLVHGILEKRYRVFMERMPEKDLSTNTATPLS